MSMRSPNKSFQHLIEQGQDTILEMARHEDYAEMFAFGFLDVKISDAWGCLEDLRKAHQQMQLIRKADVSVPEIKEKDIPSLKTNATSSTQLCLF